MVLIRTMAGLRKAPIMLLEKGFPCKVQILSQVIGHLKYGIHYNTEACYFIHLIYLISLRQLDSLWKND